LSKVDEIVLQQENESKKLSVERHIQIKRKISSEFTGNANMACTDVRIKPNLQI